MVLQGGWSSSFCTLIAALLQSAIVCPQRRSDRDRPFLVLIDGVNGLPITLAVSAFDLVQLVDESSAELLGSCCSGRCCRAGGVISHVSLCLFHLLVEWHIGDRFNSIDEGVSAAAGPVCPERGAVIGLAQIDRGPVAGCGRE